MSFTLVRRFPPDDKSRKMTLLSLFSLCLPPLQVWCTSGATGLFWSPSPTTPPPAISTWRSKGLRTGMARVLNILAADHSLCNTLKQTHTQKKKKTHTDFSVQSQLFLPCHSAASLDTVLTEQGNPPPPPLPPPPSVWIVFAGAETPLERKEEGRGTESTVRLSSVHFYLTAVSLLFFFLWPITCCGNDPPTATLLFITCRSNQREPCIVTLSLEKRKK